MTRQVRLEDDVAELVAASGPDEDSLTKKANRLLRDLLEPGPTVEAPRATVAFSQPSRRRVERTVEIPPVGRIRAHSTRDEVIIEGTIVNHSAEPVRVTLESAIRCPHPILRRRGNICGKCGDTV